MKNYKTLLSLAFIASTAHAQVFVEDTFSRGSVASPLALDSSSPDVGADWVGSANWQTDGSEAFVNASAGAASNYIAFTPTAGNVYNLSADITVESTNNAFIALSFYNTSPSVTSNPFGTDVTGFRLDGQGNAGVFFDKDGLSGGPTDSFNYSSFASAGTVDMVLDTTGANWTVALSFNGNEFHSATNLAANETIGGVAFGNGSGFTGSIDNFSLSVSTIPEPSTYAFLVGTCVCVFAGVRRRRLN